METAWADRAGWALLWMQVEASVLRGWDSEQIPQFALLSSLRHTLPCPTVPFPWFPSAPFLSSLVSSKGKAEVLRPLQSMKGQAHRGLEARRARSAYRISWDQLHLSIQNHSLWDPPLLLLLLPPLSSVPPYGMYLFLLPKHSDSLLPGPHPISRQICH